MNTTYSMVNLFKFLVPDDVCNNYGKVNCTLDGIGVGPDGWYCCPPDSSENGGTCVPEEKACGHSGN